MFFINIAYEYIYQLTKFYDLMIYDSRDILKNILYIGYGNTHQNITIVETNGISQEKK